MALVGQCGEPLPHITLQVLWSSLGGCHQGPEELGQVVTGWDLRTVSFVSGPGARSWLCTVDSGLSKQSSLGTAPVGPKGAGLWVVTVL